MTIQKHKWLIELDLNLFRNGKRYRCSSCGLRVEHFEGPDSQIEAGIEQSRKNMLAGLSEKPLCSSNLT